MSKFAPLLFVPLLAGACLSSPLPPELNSSRWTVPSTDAAAPADDASSETPDAGAPAPMALSNRCTNGKITVSGDVLNPGDVYLDGTLAEGSCGLDAITHFSNPYTGCGGFDCYFDGSSAVIRPTDGRLLYVNTFEDELREFHSDGCPVRRDLYPSKPTANDTIIATPMCSPGNGLSFRVSPEGDIYYACGPTWYDLTGATVLQEGANTRLRNVGRDRIALVGDAPPGLLNLATGAMTAIAPPLPGVPDMMAVRARDEGGFRVAIRSTGGLDGELWTVDPDGTATKVGSYPPVPSTVKTVRTAALDGCGALLQMAEGPMTFEDTIVRREVGGASAVVYDEDMVPTPLVKIHISYLVTGP